MKRIFKKKKSKQQFRLLLIAVFIGGLLVGSCDDNDDISSQDYDFVLSSPAIDSDDLLPKEYTCDGAASTVPLEWSGTPENTVCFALVMDHEVSPTDIHWYWLLYNIPAKTTSLPQNVSGIGTLGTNSVNEQNTYAAPCSKGPGLKGYTFTLYALSDQPSFSVAANKVNREVLLDAIEDITISSTSITVYYSREQN